MTDEKENGAVVEENGKDPLRTSLEEYEDDQKYRLKESKSFKCGMKESVSFATGLKSSDGTGLKNSMSASGLKYSATGEAVLGSNAELSVRRRHYTRDRGEEDDDNYSVEFAIEFAPRGHKYNIINFVTSQTISNLEQLFPHSVREEGLRYASVFLLATVAGILVALVGWLMETGVRWVTKGLYKVAQDLLIGEGIVVGGIAAYVCLATVLAGIASSLVVFVSPLAAGSGIPEIKSYLNGVRLPGLTTFKTLIAKLVGTAFSISSGLVCGREGPMIHCGGIVGSAVALAAGSGARTRFPGKLQDYFRTEAWKRDFTALGAAAGVAVAFQAPLGGLLFVMEEAATHWSQTMTWATLLAAVVSAVLGSSFEEISHGHLNINLSAFGFEFGPQSNTPFYLMDLGFFIIIGVLGGLWGALLSAIQKPLTLWRFKYVNRPLRRFCEALLIAVITALLRTIIPALTNECIPRDEAFDEAVAEKLSKEYSQFNCPEGEYNLYATLFWNPIDVTIGVREIHGFERRYGYGKRPHGAYAPEAHIWTFVLKWQPNCESRRLAGRSGRGRTVLNSLADALAPHSVKQNLLHNTNVETWDAWVLLAALAFFVIMAIFTYGIAVPSGLFIPAFAVGAVIGRLIGLLAYTVFPDDRGDFFISSYVFIGSVAGLAGATRMTLSVVLIGVETAAFGTGIIPGCVVALVAKFVADSFNTGIYDLHIELKGIPILEPRITHHTDLYYRILCRDVMARDVVAVYDISKIRDLVKVLKTYSHGSFPVVTKFVEPVGVEEEKGLHVISRDPAGLLDFSKTNLKGMIERSTIVANLKHLSSPEIRAQMEEGHSLPRNRYDIAYPNTLLKTYEEQLLNNLPSEVLDREIDLSAHVDHNPATISDRATIAEAREQFRTVGCRHLVCIWIKTGQIVGIMTRKDILPENVGEFADKASKEAEGGVEEYYRFQDAKYNSL